MLILACALLFALFVAAAATAVRRRRPVGMTVATLMRNAGARALRAAAQGMMGRTNRRARRAAGVQVRKPTRRAVLGATELTAHASRCANGTRRPARRPLALERLEHRDVPSGPEYWTGPMNVPGWFGHETQGVGLAAGDVTRNGRPDLVFVHIDNPQRANTGWYRIGRDLSPTGEVTNGWSDPMPIPGWFGDDTAEAGAALYDIDRNGQLELLVMHVDNPKLDNFGYWRVGWNLDTEGRPTGHLRTGALWTGPTVIPGWWGHSTQAAGIAVADVYDARGVYSATHTYVSHIDNPQGDNTSWYRISDELSPRGGSWRSPSRIPGWIGHETAGGDIAVADLGEDNNLDIVTCWVDNPTGENFGYLRFNRDPEPVRVPGWWGHSTQGAGLALADLNGNGRPEVIMAHVDNPSGDNFGYYRVGFELGDPPPPPPAVIIDDAAVTEGDAGSVEAEFTVRLVRPSRLPVTVAYTTGDGEALAGPDYRAASGTVTFEPGETSKTVVVRVNGDTAFEPDERFFVRLSSPENATILRGQATGTILNDDSASPTLSIDSVSQAEGNLGYTAMVFTVTLSRPSDQIVTVFYRTQDGTAFWPSDYVASSGSVSFLPGETTQTITIEILGDPAEEEDETFYVLLQNPVNAELAADVALGVGTIENDDRLLTP